MARRRKYSPAYPSIWPVLVAYLLSAGAICAFLLFNPAPREEVRVYLADVQDPAKTSDVSAQP